MIEGVLQKLRLIKGSKQSYIQSWEPTLQKWKLVVSISEKMSAMHNNLVQQLFDAVKDIECTKADCLNMRNSLLGRA